MHCPRCGQQQVSVEIKYCSRCGFPLGLVSEILFHGGFLPQLAEDEKNQKWLTRRNGVKFGLAWFLLFTFLLAPLAGIAGADEGAGAIALLGFMGGILMMLFSWMFLPSNKKKFAQPELPQNYTTSPNYFQGHQAHGALPPQQTQPAQTYVAPPASSWKAPDTGELAQPGSITEGTTKLLNRDE